MSVADPIVLRAARPAALAMLLPLLPVAAAAQVRPDPARARVDSARADSILAAQRDSLRAARARELPEVVVTAAGFEQARRDAPASITVVTRAELARQRTTSLAEALRDVEGVDVQASQGKTGGMNVSLRGMPAEYTLVLIDGRRQNSAGNVTPNGFNETSTSFLPPTSAIERIEIIRGPMATLYGSDAMGGVVNIITRKGRGGWSGTLSTDATVQEEPGFGNTVSGGAYLTGPLVQDRLALTARGSLLRRGAAELSPTGEFGEATTISRRGPSPVRGDVGTLGGRLTYTPSAAHDLWLDVDAARQRYDNRQAQLGTLDQPDAPTPRFNGYGPELRFQRTQGAVGHAWRFGRGVMETSLMRNTTETIGRTLPSGTPGGPPGSGAPDKPAGAPRTLTAASTVLDSKLALGLGGHVLTVGGQAWDAEMEDGVALAPFGYTQWALFAEDEWRFAPAFALTLGARQDAHSAFGGQLSPRAYLVWTASPEWTVKGGVSRGYKTPRVEQLVDGIIGFTGQGTIAMIGTPSLKPETSTSTELGVLYGDARGLRANVTVFNNDFRDKITGGTPLPNCTFEGAPDAPGCVTYGSFPLQEAFSQSVNVDEAVTRGVEAGIRVPFAGAWTASANYTYTHSEQLSGEGAGRPLVGTPAHMANATLRVQPGMRWDGWVRGEYRSERSRATSARNDAIRAAVGDYKPYSLLHLGGSLDVGRGVRLTATIYNLLNTDFLEYAAYEGTPTSANPSGIQYTSRYDVHQEGRRLWIGTSLDF